MGGCRCSYRTCSNTTKTRENLHFFHYPVKQKDRCKRWIDNAEKPQFYDLDEDQLRNKVVCETHFEDRYFPNPQKKRLLQGAIPTLDGDCEPEPRHSIKIQDVQLLPADDNGTIFLLETNMKPEFRSTKVESYIYTNNGLVLPINKTEDIKQDVCDVMEEMHQVQTFPSNNPMLDIEEIQPCDPLLTSDPIQTPVRKKVKVLKPTSIKIMPRPAPPTPEVVEKPVETSHTIEKKYITKIKQHSRDIALLKNLLKANGSNKSCSISTALQVLKKRLPPSLYDLVESHFPKNNTSKRHYEFLRNIHSRSPDVYHMLMDKYRWKLPHPDCFSQD